MIVARDCDPLRRFARSRSKNGELFTISAVRARPSAEIRVVEVKKLGTLYDFCGARATLCGDSRGRGQKNLRTFYDFCGARPSAEIRVVEVQKLRTFYAGRARPSAEIRVVEVQKLGTLYDFCGPRVTLCGDSRGRGQKNLRTFYDFCGARPSAEIRVVEVQKLRTFYAGRARPSAEIRVVEVQKLGTLYDFCGPRATLCGDRARRSALAVAPCEFVLVSANPLRRLCVSKRSRCGAVLARKTAFGSCLVVCAPAFAISRSRVRFPPGPRQLRLENRTFKYKRSTRSVLLQLWLENRNF